MPHTPGSFLYSTVSQLVEKVGAQGLGECCILTPNRRTAIYLQNIFSQVTNQPIWGPRLFTIEDWTAQIAELRQGEPLTLLLELWAAWNELTKQTVDFDSFYVWGQAVLNDFERLDYAMSDVGWAYNLLWNWHELAQDPSQIFSTDEEPYRQQRLSFWRGFAAPSQKSYELLRQLYQHLPDVYLSFGQRIKSKGFAYQGLITRIAAERITADRIAEFDSNMVEELGLNKQWFWIGFSNLRNAELALLKAINQFTSTQTFWDIDPYYADHPHHAAGSWFRSAGIEEIKRSQTESPELYNSKLQERPIEIRIVEAPGQIAQIKYLSHFLRQLPEEEFNKTVVVLPDETLLNSLLISMPSNIRYYNVTMGASLIRSPFYQLVEKLFEVQVRCEIHNQEPCWPRDLVQSILLHPYIRRYSFLDWLEKERDQLYQHVAQSRFFELEYDSSFSLPLTEVFERVEDNSHVLPWVIETLHKLSVQLEYNPRFSLPIVEREQLHGCFSRLVELQNHLTHYALVLEPETTRRLALEYLKFNLPFSGEPLTNLQIMGLRETRNLDFDNVFILSMNDGVVPRASTPPSLIPDEMYPQLGLTSWREEQDQACYMIWRCFHRAKKITLLYSNLNYSNQPAQRSQIIDQILYEWQLINLNLRISFPNIDPLPIESTELIPDIPASKSLQSEAQAWLTEYGLSVSALNNWLGCRLKFGLMHLLNLKKLPPLIAELEVRHEGSLLHKAIEELYKEILERKISATDLEKLNPEKVIRRLLLEELGQPGPELIGEAYLTEKQLIRRIKEILKKDQEHTPFEVLGLEKKYETELKVLVHNTFHVVKCKGTIDRIDRFPNGKVILLDYKTGKHETKKIKNTDPQSILNQIFERQEGLSTENHDQLAVNQINQALFYLWLYRREVPGAENCDFAWYSFDAENEQRFQRKLLSELLAVDLSPRFFDEYEKMIIEQIKVMINSSNGLQPTDNLRLCRYCDFANFCWRDLPE